MLSMIILLLDSVHKGVFTTTLAIYPWQTLDDLPWDVYRLFTWPLVHSNFSHAWSNLAVLLLLGPPLEEYLGSRRLFATLAVTAAVTGFVHALLFSSGLIGSSCLVLCLLLLSASHAARFSPTAGVYELPLSYLILAVTYVTREVAALGQDGGVSRFALLVGVSCGVVFALRVAPVARAAGDAVGSSAKPARLGSETSADASSGSVYSAGAVPGAAALSRRLGDRRL